MTALLEVERPRRRATARCRCCTASTFDVDEGEIVVILGANGAGKTTTLRAICGMIDGQGRGHRRRHVDRRQDSPRRSSGWAWPTCPQGRGTFADLTVEENLRLGAFTRKDAEVDADIDRWYEIFPRLRGAPRPGGRQHERRRAADAGHRPGADVAAPAAAARRAVARAWPRSSPRSCSDGCSVINQEQGTAMLVVEQNANLALDIAERGYVLEAGLIVGQRHRPTSCRPTRPSARRTWGTDVRHLDFLHQAHQRHRQRRDLRLAGAGPRPHLPGHRRC